MPVSGLRGSHLLGAAGAIALIISLGMWAPWTAESRSATQIANVAVNCEPGQQALVRQVPTAGEPQVTVQCASQPAAGAWTQTAQVDQFGRPVPVMQTQPGYVPAVYTRAPAYEAPVVRSAPVRRTAPTRAEPKRSWKKTALVIGGSAGAGAGIGAIVGGKKGALIGAAIGGGSASIFEAIKR